MAAEPRPLAELPPDQAAALARWAWRAAARIAAAERLAELTPEQQPADEAPVARHQNPAAANEP